MSEVSFAKSFLSTLDSKPTKYPANHVFDPKTFATRTPLTLPKLPSPPHPAFPKTEPAAPPAPGSAPAVQDPAAASSSAGKPTSKTKTTAAVSAQGVSGKAVLETEAFWADLRGFLEQRVKDEKEAKRLVELWRGKS